MRTEGKRGRECRRHIFRKISWRAEGKRGRESKLYSEKSLGEQKEREEGGRRLYSEKSIVEKQLSPTRPYK